jgi:hypothetical protein
MKNIPLALVNGCVVTNRRNLSVCEFTRSRGGVHVSPMSASLLERGRGLHEDLEVLERAMYRELGDPSAGKLKRADQIARDQVRPGCAAKASWFGVPPIGRHARSRLESLAWFPIDRWWRRC